MALGVPGLGCEDALLHLLNIVFPNIFETSPHVIGAVTDAIDGLRVSLGATIILQYILQGLFHPGNPVIILFSHEPSYVCLLARRVRNIYWKIYNNTYIGSQDALVAAYPRFSDDEHNSWSRPELELFI